MALSISISHSIIFPFFLFIFPLTCYSIMSEPEALLNLKKSFSNPNAVLDSWTPDSMPCNEEDQWEGVICYNGVVTGLRLAGIGLSGTINIDALVELRFLRTVSFMNNSFSGSIPDINRIGFLKALYLSGNKFSGPIPMDYFLKMRSLKKVWLSNNEFNGEIPSSLAQIPQLVELHLENNHFSGNIPNLANPSLMKLDVSNNNLQGEVPPSLWRFNVSSFGGNVGLCGEKFGTICGDEKTQQTNENKSESSSNNKNHNSSFQIASIVVGSVILIALVIFLIVKSRKKTKLDHDNADINEMSKKNEEGGNDVIQNDGGSIFEVQVAPVAPVKRVDESVKKTSSSRKGSSVSSSSKNSSVGELVMLNEEKGIFGLPDLMKASAEVLGNGGFGSSYKAVMANGVAVVVKRTREMNGLGKDVFDAEIKKLVRIKHWNILTPLAYHYRKDEKLVISEYVPRGSLLYLLHGDRGPSHAELDWQARLKIIQGIAKGMQYLHTEFASSNLPHGNLKSSNVLLGPDYEPMLVDYGYINLVNPSSVPQTLFAYKAPEAAQHGIVSHSCDVYCLGVVILEILTGKFPSQYLSNGKGGTDIVQWVASAVSEGREVELLDPEIASSKSSIGEMVKLLQIGAFCTESSPQKRLEMMEAIRRIEEIRHNMGSSVQESRTIEILPSLKDGYADSHQHIVDYQGDQSRRRHGSNAFGSTENFEFGVSQN